MKNAPVFVIGNPRCGSTIFFELLSSHRDFGWLTNYEAKFPSLYCGGALRRVLERKHWHITGRKKEYAPTTKLNRFIPKRAEGYAFWTTTTGVDFRRSWLWSTRADKETAEKLQKITRRILLWQGKNRFSTKFTGPGRIGYLKSLFPEARFIHLLRQPEAQIASVMNVDFWKEKGGYEQLWWYNDLPPFLEEFLNAAQKTNDPVALAAAQYHAVIEGIRTEARTELSEDEYHEVWYENVVEQPREIIENLWEKMGLDVDKQASRFIESYPVSSSRNTKLADEISQEHQNTIRNWIYSTLR